MLRWFRKTHSSYNLQPLLLKRNRELEKARALNNWLGERRQAQEGHLDDVGSLRGSMDIMILYQYTCACCQPVMGGLPLQHAQGVVRNVCFL